MADVTLPGLEAERSPLLVALAPLVGHLVVNVTARPAPRFDVYVGRTFAGRVDVGFGSPFPVGRETPAERLAVVRRYFTWLNGSGAAASALRSRLRSGELDGLTLACWCAPKLCHGHILAALAAGHADVVKAALRSAP